MGPQLDEAGPAQHRLLRTAANGQSTNAPGGTAVASTCGAGLSLVAATASPGSPELRDNTEVVTLVASNGAQIKLPLGAACCSHVIATMLDPQYGWVEAADRVVHLADIPQHTLVRVVEYLQYRWTYDGIADHPAFEIAPEESLELLLAADYLDM